MKLIAKIDPQPPVGIAYMLGGETWLPEDQRTPYRLVFEEWGNLGPLELRPEIRDNGHGLRVRVTEVLAPAGAIGFARIDGVVWWTDTDAYGRTAEDLRS
ncbi:hypothetical protein [Burkholderia gladioli]|uniref:hypothetical protein n=1 Tax=Burkholderia gladioli TaxID=28095 RepID=UPI00163EFA72|nr:hypothetical protein [Burkholderia gladioli]